MERSKWPGRESNGRSGLVGEKWIEMEWKGRERIGRIGTESCRVLSDMSIANGTGRKGTDRTGEARTGQERKGSDRQERRFVGCSRKGEVWLGRARRVWDQNKRDWQDGMGQDRKVPEEKWNGRKGVDQSGSEGRGPRQEWQEGLGADWKDRIYCGVNRNGRPKLWTGRKG